MIGILKKILIAVAVGLVIGLIGGIAIGWRMASPKTTKWPATGAPSIRQRDGSLIAERVINPAAMPRQQLPPGARAERTLSVTLRPAIPGSGGTEAQPTPSDVHVDMTMVRMPDGTVRPILSSPDGEVVQATETIISAPPTVEPSHHTLVLAYNPATRDASLDYARRIGSIGPMTFSLGGRLNRRDGHFDMQIVLITTF